MISPGELEVMAQAYQAGRDATRSPEVQRMVDAEMRRVKRAFDRLPFEVRFVDFDPYSSYEEMKADVLANNRMLVWTGASDTPLWDPLTNWQARAVHDWDHIQNDVDFSIGGEVEAYRRSAARRPGLAPLYLSEIVLQAAVQVHTGDFEEQKLVLPQDAVVKVVDSLREARRRGEPAEALVWYAAGILEFSSLPGLMAHLAARGLSWEEAVIIADAASMLRERKV